jgi:hypothetical protein
LEKGYFISRLSITPGWFPQAFLSPIRIRLIDDDTHFMWIIVCTFWPPKLSEKISFSWSDWQQKRRYPVRVSVR